MKDALTLAMNRLRRRSARLGRRRLGFAFDPLAAYLGLLIGIALGAASPAGVPVLANAAVQLCVVGALEVGRDGIAECVAP
jgi:hypothetical protein